MSWPFDDNKYVATIIRHIDGDTTVAELQMGLDISLTTRLRWSGINAPEIKAEGGPEAKAAVEGKLPVGSRCIVSTRKTDDYGRYLATFLLEDGTSVNDWMIQNGFAKPDDGRKQV